MRLKTFHGSSLTEAMRLVREALGEDAIIVATRDDDGGGIRVTAALEDAPEASTTLPQRPVKSPQEPEPSDSDALEILATALAQHHVTNILAERFLSAATAYASDDALLALGAAFSVHLNFQTLPENKPLIFVGPPGAGKTLCTAKFATRAALAKKPVTLISADIERAGGMEQLAAFARLLKTPLMEIEDPHALHEAVAMQPSENLILVDMPGCNPFQETERERTRALLAAAKGTAVLVLPADMDAHESIDMVRAFQGLGATCLLPTRLDVVRRFGSLLRAACETQIPLASYSASAKVTEPPSQLNPVALARLVLMTAAARAAESLITGESRP